MIPPQYDYKIAAGWNQPDGSLVNIEAIRPVGGKYFYAPSAYSSFNPGSVRLRMDGNVYNTGFPSADWQFSTLWRDQFQFLQQEYTVGGNSYSGNVTVQTRNIEGTYTKYNAVLVLPTLPEIERNFTAYRNVSIKFTRLS